MLLVVSILKSASASIDWPDRFITKNQLKSDLQIGDLALLQACSEATRLCFSENFLFLGILEVEKQRHHECAALNEYLLQDQLPSLQ